MTLPPRRPPFSVSRHLSERDRAARAAASARTGETPAADGLNIAGVGGLTGMLGALRGLIEQLAKAPQQAGTAGESASRTGPGTEYQTAQEPAAGDTVDGNTRTFTLGGSGARMVFGYTLRMGTDGISAERFGDVPAAGPAARAETTTNAAPAPLQPIVEVYQDGDMVVVIAELPGAEPDRIVCRADGVRLLIEAAGARHYRKELTLPVPVRSDAVAQTIQNGILEVRLMRADAS